MVSNPPLLGDLVARMMFSRIEFWMEHINKACQRFLCHSWDEDTAKLYEARI